MADEPQEKSTCWLGGALLLKDPLEARQHRAAADRSQKGLKFAAKRTM